MSDENIEVRGAKPEDAPSDVAAEIVREMADFKKAMKEEREAAELAVRQQIEDINAKIAARQAFHVNDQKEKPVSPIRIVNAILNARDGRPEPWKDAGYELEVIRAHEGKRTMSAGSDTAGGYWVPEQFLGDQFVENLRATTVIYDLGATQLTDLMGSPVVIPKKTGSSTAYWVPENSAITASELTAGQINLEPHACAAVVQMSNRLRMLSNPSVEAMVNNDISTSIGLKIEKAALDGPNVAGEPTGIKNIGGGLNTATTATINLTNANAMVYTLELDHANFGALGWLMHPRTWNTLRNRERVQVAELVGRANEGGIGAMAPMSYVGYPVRTSTQVAQTASSVADVFFGNWNDLIVARWQGIEFAVTTEASDGTNHAFMQNQFWVRAIAEVDIGIRREESFCVNSSVTD